MPTVFTNAQLDRWIKAAGHGDRDALGKLYRAAGSAVYAYALSILKNRTDAEDVLHDCFIAIYHAAADYRSQEKPMAWLMTITRNRCYKLLQRQKRYLPMESETYRDSGITDPDERLLVRSCMQALNDEDRQIVILHAVAGCTHRQIAAMMELKPATVASRYHRAIQKLKSCF